MLKIITLTEIDAEYIYHPNFDVKRKVQNGSYLVVVKRIMATQKKTPIHRYLYALGTGLYVYYRLYLWPSIRFAV